MIFLSEILFKLKHCYLISSSCPTPKRFFTDSSLKPIWHSRYNVHFWINDNHNEEEELPEHPINKVWPMTVVIRGSLSVPSRVSFFPNLNHNLPKNVVYDCNPKTWSDGYHFCKFYFEIPNVTEECFVNLLLVLQNTADKYKHSYRSALKYPPKCNEFTVQLDRESIQDIRQFFRELDLALFGFYRACNPVGVNDPLTEEVIQTLPVLP